MQCSDMSRDTLFWLTKHSYYTVAASLVAVRKCTYDRAQTLASLFGPVWGSDWLSKGACKTSGKV
jgi:hypothetical protein